MPREPSSIAALLAAAWPWTGRADELAFVAHARAEPDCPGVVVTATAGVGKSRLAREACAVAEREGALVEWVQATASAGAVPLGAFAGLLPDDVRTDDALELMRRSVDRLRERAGRRPVVLAVDDAQLLDPVSAALVLHLTSAASVFVLATVRAGEPSPDAIVSLWKDAGAWRLELDRLGDDAVHALVEAALGGPVEQRALRWVEATSQGNALYVRELVLGAVGDGTLTSERGLWRMSAPPPVSRPLAELIAQRMAALGELERGPLELLALGEPLHLDELAALTSYDSVEASEAVGMAVVAAPPAAPDVRLAHPLYGEVVRGELPVLRGRALRLRLAETVGARDPLPPDDALRIARWQLDAGARVPLQIALHGARAATLAGDPDLGAQLAGLAVEDGGGVEARLLLARAHAARRRFAEAEEILAGLEGEFDAQETAIAYLELRAVAVLYWGLGRPDEAYELGVRARAWWPGPDWQQRVAPFRLLLEGMRRGFGETTGLSAQLLDDPALAPAIRHQIEPLRAISLFFNGRAREAYAHAKRIRPPIPLRDESATLALRAWGLLGCESGEDWDGLETGFGEVVREGVRANDHVAVGIGANTIATLLFLRGRYADMERWLAEAELHLEHADAQGTLITVRTLQVGLAHATADGDATAAALERLRATVGDRPPRAIQVPYIARAEAWGALSRGDDEAAQRGLLAAAGAHDVPTFGSQLTYEALRAGAPAGSLAAAQARFAERSDAPLVAAYAGHTAALAAPDGTALLAAAERMAAIGALRYATEAAADAASVFLDEGRQDSARRASALVAELHQPGQGAAAPAAGGPGGDALGLTGREAQLAELAAQGLTNAEIADRLVLSVRTVESHLYHAMQKLGVSDRRELRRPAGDR